MRESVADIAAVKRLRRHEEAKELDARKFFTETLAIALQSRHALSILWYLSFLHSCQSNRFSQHLAHDVEGRGGE